MKRRISQSIENKLYQLYYSQQLISFIKLKSTYNQCYKARQIQISHSIYLFKQPNYQLISTIRQIDWQLRQRMSNIEKKVKQSSLSEFYKKVDHQALVPYYYQLASVSLHAEYLQQTPINYLYQSNTPSQDKNILSYQSNTYLHPNDNSNLSSQLVASYIPDQILDIHSSHKPIDSLFNPLTQQYYPILGQQQQQQQSIYMARDIQQELFRDYEQQGRVGDKQISKRNLQDSEVDYNLSVQQQQIKHSDQLKAAPRVNRFRLSQPQQHVDSESQFADNFIITPENSLIKSPSHIKMHQQQYHHVDTKTPQIVKQIHDDRQGACSEVIEKLRFHHQNGQSEVRSQNKESELRGDDDQGELGCESNKRCDYQNSRSELLNQQQLKQFCSSDTYSQNTNHLQQEQQQQKHQQYQQKQQQQQQSQPQLKQPNKPYSFNNSPQQVLQQPNSNSKNSQILSSDDEDPDSSELLTKIRLLQSQVSQLKTHKYHYAINQYRQQTRQELQKKLQQSIGQINQKYQLQQAGLKKQHEVQITIYNKSIQDVNKYKKTYAIILGQLRDNKEKIQAEYNHKVQQVNRFKQRLVQQWKRNSNQEIKKIINNTHPKHSIKLNNPIQKPNNIRSTENPSISPFVKQKSQQSQLLGNQLK